MSDYSHTEKEAFKQLNHWILDSVEEFFKTYKHVHEGSQHMLTRLSANNSESVEFDVECEPLIYCLNKKSEWIGVSHCLLSLMRESGFDRLDREEDWDHLLREKRGSPTCNPLHDIEDHWRYPVFKGGEQLNPLDISQLQLYINVVRQAFFWFPTSSEYPVILSKLMVAERWLMEQPLIPVEFSMYADNSTVSHPVFRVHVMQIQYSEDHDRDDVVIKLGEFFLSDLHSGDISKDKLIETVISTEGYLDSLFMHRLQCWTGPSFHSLKHADMIWVEIENRMVWKSKRQ